uniref:NACHT LRR and PYD domain-containing protein n=1 Tax=Astyanax mexicanus TaxID=7994 RepID=W5LL80_ASTMX
MCHIPVFCWIAATVLDRMLGEAETGEIPKTLTQMFTHFLIFQIKHRNQKYHKKCDHDPQKRILETKENILALGKLAFQQLEKGNLIFYEEDLKECGINIREGSVCSGVCTQIFREELLHLGKVFSFVHLNVQEFLAALYVYISFFNKDGKEQLATDLSDLFNQSTMSDLLKSAVDKALQSENGHLDLFLRFLLGLSLESNQTLLSGLLTVAERSSHHKEDTVQYIKEKIRENPSTEKSINLFHCLNELNNHSLVQEVQEYVNRRNHHPGKDRLSPDLWSALVFVMLNSDEKLDNFDLHEYHPSEESLLFILLILEDGCVPKKHCILLILPEITLCANLASALSCSSLIELDLSYNKLGDSGVQLLSNGLKNPNFLHFMIYLSGCNLTGKSCAAISSSLSSNYSHLSTLNLSNNKLLQDSGVKLLSTGLKSSHCKLEILMLCNCSITDEGYTDLASALKSNPSSHLRELNLDYNKSGESGVKLLSELQEDPHSNLKKLL